MDFNEILKKEKSYRYQLLSRMQSDCNYYLGNGNRYAGHLWGEDEVKHIAYMKALWNSFGKNEKPEWLTMEQILEYEEKIGIKAILVERDYKGVYERFALTPEEFEKTFPDTYKHFGPINESNSDTLKPMVHIWFSPVVVGDSQWNDFFIDMEEGLPDSDIEAGNLAYIRDDLFQSLGTYMQKEQRFYVYNVEFGTPGYGCHLTDGFKSYNDAVEWIGENRPDLLDFKITNDFKMVGPKEFISDARKPALSEQVKEATEQVESMISNNKSVERER